MSHSEMLDKLGDVSDQCVQLAKTIAAIWPETIEARQAVGKTVVSMADAHNLIERAGAKIRVAMKHLKREGNLS